MAYANPQPSPSPKRSQVAPEPMVAKFGLILIVLASALLASLAGTVAPDSVNIYLHQALAAARQQLAPANPASAASASAGAASHAGLPQIVPLGVAGSASAAASPAVVGGASDAAGAGGASAPGAVTAPASGTASAATASSAAGNVALSSLLLPTLPASTATYALQAGQFASQQAARDLAAGLSAQGVTSTVIVTTDDSGTAWAVVTLGRFGSADEALSQRSYLANKLGLPQYLAPITLPPPPKPPN
ncbi:SPOR domain-containing protein [Rhodoferax sp.]|uniref:SPOR domain-containing protein n=1 Tax=Rhodoferax sp. TaxID=50421 RepID=UPI002758E3F8|nr:SPOR domain-containing protein [Rhodoferax sp.]